MKRKYFLGIGYSIIDCCMASLYILSDITQWERIRLNRWLVWFRMTNPAVTVSQKEFEKLSVWSKTWVTHFIVWSKLILILGPWETNRPNPSCKEPKLLGVLLSKIMLKPSGMSIAKRSNFLFYFRAKYPSPLNLFENTNQNPQFPNVKEKYSIHIDGYIWVVLCSVLMKAVQLTELATEILLSAEQVCYWQW